MADDRGADERGADEMLADGAARTGAAAWGGTIPITLITGFLGSGKTTLINALLKDERLTDTAVIVNEFGEIGLDHLLVESAFDQMVLMDNGCLCCTVRGDLIDTLSGLMDKVEAGTVPPFFRVMIETTGLADPAPVAQTLLSDDATAARFSLQAIVTTVDGVNGAATLQTYDEARAQAALADLVLVTKADSAQADVAGVMAAVKAINPGAPITVVAQGALDPARIIAATGSDPATIAAHAHAADHAPAPGHASGHAHDHDGDDAHDGHGHTVHRFNIASASIIIDEPLDFSTLTGWLEWLTALRGPDVLRIKGLVAVAGCAGPVLVQGVQHVFYPPRQLADWPDDDRRSRVVIIARDIPPAALAASLDAFRQAERRAA